MINGVLWVVAFSALIFLTLRVRNLKGTVASLGEMLYLKEKEVNQVRDRLDDAKYKLEREREEKDVTFLGTPRRKSFLTPTKSRASKETASDRVGVLEGYGNVFEHSSPSSDYSSSSNDYSSSSSSSSSSSDSYSGGGGDSGGGGSGGSW